MAEWGRETPWRQGDIASQETGKKLGLGESGIVVIISHDCDLAALPNREPEVELIVGRQVEKAGGNYTHAKNVRTLHLEFRTSKGPVFVELTASNKTRVLKNALADEIPNSEFKLDPGNRSILQRWLAARYRRSAFPEEFEKRLNDREPVTV
jgi:hypothetical protein